MFSTPYASSRLTGPPLPKDVGLGEDKWGMLMVAVFAISSKPNLSLSNQSSSKPIPNISLNETTVDELVELTSWPVDEPTLDLLP